ncbi:unnamed protein product [Meloidogyne enterolobii]|uniref:Uncharacterized protein n=1 Tax=Meloidogyne enterolobii TaxID=390850 RepID=A0ACB0Y5P6_MELEN
MLSSSFKIFIFVIFLQILLTKYINADEETIKQKTITATTISPTTQKVARKVMKLERNGNNYKELMDIMVVNGMINKKTYQPKDLQILLEGFSEGFFSNLKKVGKKYIFNLKKNIFKAETELKQQTEQFKSIRTKLQTKIECLEKELLQGKQFLMVLSFLLLIILVLLVFGNICLIKRFLAKFNKNGFKHVRMTVGEGDVGEMEQI